MGKIKKRFISMFIVIATILTMMPVQFLMNEKLAYAANPDLVADSINELPISAYIDQFKVYAEGKAANLKEEVTALPKTTFLRSGITEQSISAFLGLANSVCKYLQFLSSNK